MAPARVDELTSERASFTVGTEQAKTECDTLVTPIRELEVSAATNNGVLIVEGLAVRALKVVIQQERIL